MWKIKKRDNWESGNVLTRLKLLWEGLAFLATFAAGLAVAFTSDSSRGIYGVWIILVACFFGGKVFFDGIVFFCEKIEKKERERRDSIQRKIDTTYKEISALHAQERDEMNRDYEAFKNNKRRDYYLELRNNLKMEIKKLERQF